jgi:hypothetical protein
MRPVLSAIVRLLMLFRDGPKIDVVANVVSRLQPQQASR